MKIRKAGYLYIIVTIFIAMAGVNTGNNMVYLIASFLLAYMALSGWIAQMNLARLEVEIITPQECFARTPIPIIVKIHNRKSFLPSFFLTTKMHILGKEKAEIWFLHVPARDTVSGMAEIKINRRGVVGIDSIIIQSGFPFNFFDRYQVIKIKREMFLFPRPERCNSDMITVEGNCGRGGSGLGVPNYDDMYSIREYIAGDPPKFINWKATAKTDKIKVNELGTETPESLILNLTNIPPSQIERTLSCCTYLVLKLTEKGVPIGIKTNRTFIQPATGKNHRRKLLRTLALYDDGQNGY